MADVSPIAAPSPPPVDFSKQIADVQAQESAETSRLQTERDAAMKPVEAERASTSKDVQGMLAKGPETVPLPENTAKHIDPKTLNETASMMMTLAGLAGLLTRRPMTAALGNMTAAMKGLQEGDEEQYARSYKEFQDNYRKAADLSKQKLTEYDRVLKSREMSLGEKDRELTAIAKRYGDQIAAASKSFEARIKHIESERTAAEKSQEHVDTVNRWNEDRTERSREHQERLAEIQAFHSGTLEQKEKATGVKASARKGMNPTMEASVRLDIKELEYSLAKLREMKDTTGSIFFADETKHGALGGAAARQVTPEQQQIYDAYANRIATAVASVQSMGRGQISDSKVREARKLVPVFGDSPGTVKVKLQQIENIMHMARDVLDGPAGAPAAAGAAEPPPPPGFKVVE